MSAFERIVGIDRAIRTRGGITVAWAADRFSVSTRQIKRDIEYLRDRLDAPIVWDQSGKRYVYERQFLALEFADERALITLCLLKSLLVNEHYIPIASQDMLEFAASRLPEVYRKVANHIHYHVPVSQPVNMGTFADLVQAIGDDRRVGISYVNAEDRSGDRVVEPERLVHYSGRWYLVAFDVHKKDLRTFHISRIRSLTLLRDKVVHDPERDERVSRFIEDGYGIFNGPAHHRAVIRIRGRAAQRVAEQTWHPDQVITSVSTDPQNPAVEIELPVSQWPELLSKVLSFGSSAEAVSPAEFRALWSAEVRKMAAMV